MEKEIMIAELSANIEKHRNELLDLMQAYDLAKLGRKQQEEASEKIYNQVLAEHEFFANEGCVSLHVKAGDRIIDDECSFLMSGADLERYLNIAGEYMYKAGITDKEGTYIVKWVTIANKAYNALLDFIIETILPAPMAIHFRENRRRLIVMNKLVAIIRKAVGVPDPIQTAVSPIQ